MGRLFGDQKQSNPVCSPQTVAEKDKRVLKANLVNVQRGTNAGWTLARPAAQISLLDVYQATLQEPLFEFHHTPPSQECPVGRGIQPALTRFYGDAEIALKQHLARSTVADVLQETLALYAQRP
jgi:DNA-binding IscR family transcriptional regulator